MTPDIRYTRFKIINVFVILFPLLALQTKKLKLLKQPKSKKTIRISFVLHIFYVVQNRYKKIK